MLSYKKFDFNETLVRRDFIDPFFKALGWGVDNTRTKRLTGKDKINVSNASRADFMFCPSVGVLRSPSSNGIIAFNYSVYNSF